MEERKGFGSNFGFLMAAIGSAVGLGNIWGFPNKMGANGGFTFLIIYLILAVLCGFVVMVGELAIGRKTGKGAVAAYRSLSQRFKWVGWLGVASAFLIMSFYCALGGYCLKYVVLNIGNLTGAAFGSNGLSGSEVFGTFLTSQGEGVIYGLIFVVLTMVIVMGGVSGGIEKFCGIGMPALFFMLLICIVRACTLPGAVDGLKYMFVPGWAVANGVIEKAPSIFEVISTAGGQMFFSLSIGMGAMITYGSYLDKKEKLTSSVTQIAGTTFGVSLLAGMMIIPSSFAALGSGEAVAENAGPSLMYIVLPEVFNSMGSIGGILGGVFFILVIFAALTSSISLVETCVSIISDGANMTRKKALAIVTAFLLVAAFIVNMGYSGLSFIQPLGEGSSILDFLDFISNSVMMPIAAIMTCIFVGWVIKPKTIIDEVRESSKFRAAGAWTAMIKYIAPVCIVLILITYVAQTFGLVSL